MEHARADARTFGIRGWESGGGRSRDVADAVAEELGEGTGAGWKDIGKESLGLCGPREV